MPDFFIGLGFDIHSLVEGRKFKLGGIEIPYSKGPLGHSDGDALLHALTDAILSAGGLPDIGTLFPDRDPQYKDKESVFFLRKALELIKEKALKVSQVDLTILLEEPKISPYYSKIREFLAMELQISEEFVRIKARTTEGLIFQKEREGVAVWALVVLEREK